MTIRPGAPWGMPRPAPAGVRVVADADDLAAALADLSAPARGVEPSAAPDAVPEVGASSGRPLLGIVGGPLARTLGVAAATTTAAFAPGRPIVELPIDLLEVRFRDRTVWAAGGVVARRRWWRGAIVAWMNAEHLGDWDVAPRAHPNDGRLDLLDVDPALSVRDRWRARRRLPLGTHVPHPLIRTSQVRADRRELAAGVGLEVDGRQWATGPGVVEIRVVPDACRVAIPGG